MARATGERRPAKAGSGTATGEQRATKGTKLMSVITTTGFVPRDLATRASAQLAMQNLWLTGRVLPMGARLWVRHEFQSQEPKPIEVVYGFMLPRDATLRRFHISGDGFSVDSELREKTEAREIYEQGI